MSFRKENKFILSKKKLFEFKQWLNQNSYSILFEKRYINSIYFDSKNFMIYKDSIEGTTPRKKIRIRFYENLKNKSKRSVKKITVESKSMKEILNISKIDKCIDFINIDVEGWDYKILKNIDLNQLKPKLISVETHNVDGSKSKDFESIIKLMNKGSFSIYKRVGPTTLFNFSS